MQNCLRTCYVETVYVLWRNYNFNDFKVFDKMLDCLVLREHDLASTKHRACIIEHTYNNSTTVA
jgi:hypothetical protein